jgi:hypothetical protein
VGAGYSFNDRGAKAWRKTKTREWRTWFDIWITPVLDLNKDAAYPVGHSLELQTLDCSLFSDMGHDLSRTWG